MNSKLKLSLIGPLRQSIKACIYVFLMLGFSTSFANVNKESLTVADLPIHSAPKFTRNTDIVFLGNSLTLREPSKEIDWFGHYGMAASSIETDYVHQTLRFMNIQKERAYIRNLYPLELDSSGLDEVLADLRPVIRMSKYLVIQIGDNADPKRHKDAFSELLNGLLASSQGSNAQVLCLSTWWDSELNVIIKEQCLKAGAKYVYIGDLYEEQVKRNDRQFKDLGVNAHPQDTAMRDIAERIYETFN